MSLFPTIIIFLLGSTYATPVVPNALSANVVCLSNNVILRALRDPAHTAEASSFCSSFIRSTTSTTVTAAATRIIATLTITPEPVVVTNTVTTYASSNRTSDDVNLVADSLQQLQVSVQSSNDRFRENVKSKPFRHFSRNSKRDQSVVLVHVL